MKQTAILAALLALTACADATRAVNSDVTPAKLQSDTASYFATSKRNVRVGNFKQSMIGTAYKARVGRTTYDCNYFRGAVSCNRAL